MIVERFFEVAVNTPLHKTFTYKLLSPTDEKKDYSGVLVKVPLRRQIAEGVIVSEVENPKADYEIKEIHEISTEAYPIHKKYLDWLMWISEYYVYPLGQTLQLMFPPVKREGRKSKKASPVPVVEKKDFFTLTEEQNSAFEKIHSQKGFHAHLLFGVTGSGKTEVYLELLKKVVSDGQQGLVLVPEISLTPQLVRRFSERFGDDQIAVIHSHLTDREKTDQWWSVVEGRKQILIGARSALFCPFPNLGLIVIDEEHETSFKQDEKLKYHARDCAIMLAKNLDIPIVLGSATPSLESWKNAIEGKYQLHKLKSRIAAAQMPHIEVIDMRKIEDEKNSDLPTWLSLKLYKKIKQRLEDGEQSALFLNRRGLSQIVMCRECGDTRGCPNCDVSLSLHAKTHLVCHYCGYHEDLNPTCRECKQGEPKAIGIGTEKIEEEIKNLFPRARTIRLDRDEIYNRETLDRAISLIEKNEVDILIGTQMIAKGLDFPMLTLVGILLADIGFNFPDFRSPERNFQLLTQVSGRPGRHSKNGEVVIQTYNPDYPSLKYSQKNDFSGFAEQELLHRKELSYPPYGRLASLKIQGNDAVKVKNYCAYLEKRSGLLQKKFPTLLALGPAQAPIFKIKNKYRYHMLIKSSSSKNVREFYLRLIEKEKLPSGVQITLDIDPLNTT